MMVNRPLHSNCLHLWHRQFGHVSFQWVAKTLSMLTNEKVLPCEQYLDCVVCKQTKTNAYPVLKRSSRVATKPLELCHLDVVGPYPKSYSKNQFFLVITDDYSQYSRLYVLKHKSEVFTYFKDWPK